MKRSSHIATLALFLLSASAQAQGTAGVERPRVPGPLVHLQTDRACADAAHGAALANQLRMRLPETMVVSGELQTVGHQTVTWAPVDGVCVVTFKSGENVSAMNLEANADLEQIELAASRIAFLASVAAPNGSSAEPPLGVPGAEISEAALAAAKAAPAESDPPIPPPPEDLESPKEPVETEEPPQEEDSKPPELVRPPQTGPKTAPKLTARQQRRAAYTHPASQVFLVPGLSLPPNPPQGSAPRMAVGLLGTSTAGVEGFAFASLFNIQTDYVEGFQFSGLFNRTSELDGFQSAGIFNSAADLDGTQMAGVFNHASSGKLGFQLAGVLNIHGGDLTGSQVAGVLNIADDVHGASVAAALNIADDVSGFQVALINIADDVGGAQVGLINIASESDLSAGLINIIWSEPFWFGAETSSDGYTLASMKHGSKYLKWSLWAGTSAVAESPVLLAGLGLGLYLPLGRWHLAADVIGLDVSGPNAPLTNAGVLEFRLSGGWSLFRRLAIVGGVGYRSFFSDGDDFGLVPQFAGDLRGDTSGGAALAGWPHAFVGVRF